MGVVKGERGKGLGPIPFFEFLTVRVVFDVADHEVGEMAVLVGDYVD